MSDDFSESMKSALVQVAVGVDALGRRLEERAGRIADLERALNSMVDQIEVLRQRCEAAEREAAALRERLGAA